MIDMFMVLYVCMLMIGTAATADGLKAQYDRPPAHSPRLLRPDVCCFCFVCFVFKIDLF